MKFYHSCNKFHPRNQLCSWAFWVIDFGSKEHHYIEVLSSSLSAFLLNYSLFEIEFTTLPSSTFHLKMIYMMCHFLGIYKCTFTHKKLGIPKEHLAGKSLPHLVSLSIDNNLNLNQVRTRIHSTHAVLVHPQNMNLIQCHFSCVDSVHTLLNHFLSLCFSLTLSWLWSRKCWIAWRRSIRPN